MRVRLSRVNGARTTSCVHHPRDRRLAHRAMRVIIRRMRPTRRASRDAQVRSGHRLQLRPLQCLLQIGDEVVDVLDADRQPHHVLADAGLLQFRR